MRITRVRALNFRCLKKIDLPLGPLTVIIGPNGAGKSSFLELTHLFRSLQSLSQRFSELGSFQDCVRWASKEQVIGFGVNAQNAGTSFKYDIRLNDEGGRGFYVGHEHLEFMAGASRPRPVQIDRADVTVSIDDGHNKSGGRISHDSETVLKRFTNQVPELDEVFRTFRSISLWPVLKFDPRGKVASPQQMQPTLVPDRDGGNLFSALYSMKTDRKEVFQTLIDDLQSALPALEDLEFPLAGAGFVNLKWIEQRQSYYSNQLSDGTLRLLWLLTVLHSLPDDGLILIDEPELSFHPQWLMLLAAFLRKASVRMTIVVATQSAEFVRWLEPGELVIANTSEDGTTFARATEHPNLDKWLEDFSLSELWTMGELGGRS